MIKLIERVWNWWMFRLAMTRMYYIIRREADKENECLVEIVKAWNASWSGCDAVIAVQRVGGAKRLLVFATLVFLFLFVSIKEEMVVVSSIGCVATVCLAVGLWPGNSSLLVSYDVGRRADLFISGMIHLDRAHRVKGFSIFVPKTTEKSVRLSIKKFEELAYGILFDYLRTEAQKVKALSVASWRQKEYDVRFKDWKGVHEAFRRIFGALPSDYKFYFAPTKKEAWDHRPSS